MKNRPNILLFLTDDHGAWALGCNGNREVITPNLNGIASEGVNFRNAFTPCPVCSPARACLLTGRTPSQVGIHDWIQEAEPECGDFDWLRDEVTLPQILRENGYYTGLSGKWHLGRSHETPRGLDWYFGLPRWQGGHVETYTYMHNGQEKSFSGNKTGIITDNALDFLDQTPDGRPFYLNVGYIATHSPYDASAHDPEMVALYEGANFADIPPYVPHPWVKNEGGPNDLSPEECRSRYTGYYAGVSDIDRNVGRILDRLRAQGRLDNTLVIYTGDHGCTLGHHGFWGKGNSTRPLNMYDTSLRIPLLMRWPAQIAAQSEVSRCIDHYDTFQAIAEWTGCSLRAERRYPGQSLAPLAHGQEEVTWDDTSYGEYGDLRMIRTPDTKFVRRFPDGPHDLFDLKADPGELNNLADTTAVAGIQARLERQLDEFYRQHEDPQKSGLKVKELRRHNSGHEAWRDGLRESRGLQVY